MTRVLRNVLALLTALVLIAITATLVFGVETLLDGKLRTGDTVTVPYNRDVGREPLPVRRSGDGRRERRRRPHLGGGLVEINGNVSGDLLVAGGRVLVVGTVEGDVRAAGGQIEVTGSVAGDALVTGGQVTLVAGLVRGR